MSGPSVKVALSGDRVLVIPTIPIENNAIHEDRKSTTGERRKTSATPRCLTPQRRNYLLKGGQRAMDRQLHDQWNACREHSISELVAANEALARELVRTRTEHENFLEQNEEERSELSSKIAKNEDVERGLKEALRLHDDRIRELQKKVREEYEHRLYAETQRQKAAESVQILQQQNTEMRAQQNRNLSQIQTHSQAAVESADKLNLTRKTLADMESRLEEHKTEWRNLVEQHQQLLNGSRFLEGALQSLTEKAAGLSQENRWLRSRMFQQTEILNNAETKLSDQQKERETHDEIVAELRSEIQNLHTALNNERLTASKNRMEVTRLKSDLTRDRSLIESLQHARSKLESEISEVREELSNEHDSHHDLVKQHAKAKESFEKVLSTFKKKEVEWTEETNAKIEELNHGFQREQTSYIAELRSFKQRIKNTQSETEALTAQRDSLRSDKEALQSQLTSVKNSLIASEDRESDLKREISDRADALKRIKAQLTGVEEKSAQRTLAYDQRLVEYEAALEKLTQFKKQHFRVQNNLEITAAELQSLKETSKNETGQRDERIKKLHDSVTSLTSRLHKAEEARASESDQHHREVREWEREKISLKEEALTKREALEVVSKDTSLLKEELSRIVKVLRKKDNVLNVTKTESAERERQTLQAIEERDRAVDAFEQQSIEKEGVIKDLISAMQGEEATRKIVEEDLTAAQERNRDLEAQLKTTQMTLQQAITDAAKCKDSYTAVREKVLSTTRAALYAVDQAEGLKVENASLVDKFNKWAMRVMNECENGVHERRPQFPTSTSHCNSRRCSIFSP